MAPSNRLMIASIVTGLFLLVGPQPDATGQDVRPQVRSIDIRHAVEQLTPVARPLGARPTPQPSQQTTTRHMSRATRVTVVALAAAGGFFGGGLAGAGIENAWFRCACDDPGLQGFVIGAPVGAVVGGILGFHFTR